MKLHCSKMLQIKERDFPTPFLMPCRKHGHHAGDHYAVDPAFDFPSHRIDGTRLRLVGRAEFHWEGGEVWVGENCVVMERASIDATEEISRRPEFYIEEAELA